MHTFARIGIKLMKEYVKGRDFGIHQVGNPSMANLGWYVS